MSAFLIGVILGWTAGMVLTAVLAIGGDEK